MESDNLEGAVQLSKKDRLKKFNEKLELMLKSKNIPKQRLTNNAQSSSKEAVDSLGKSQKVNEAQTVNVAKTQTSQEEKSQKRKPEEKTKKIKKIEKKDDVTIRKAAGQVWKDATLEQWPQNDYRIFCGNLGNEVTDEVLCSVFRVRYQSFQMGRVVRDKRTGKSRGYGFVSFREGKDFLNALKEMNGKYVGNRPVKLTKSSWKDRSLDSEKNHHLPSDFSAISSKETNKICVNYKYVSPF